jgi:hypothetical protein
MTPDRASEYDSVPTFGADAPLFPVGGGESKKCGIGPVSPPDNAEALGVRAGAGVAGAAVAVGAAVTAACVTPGAVVTAGAGAGADHAGEIVTAGMDAKDMTSVATSAVFFRSEFICTFVRPPPR